MSSQGDGPEPDWDAGLCASVDPELWWPEKGANSREARAICARCPIIADCLAFALDNEIDFGIWGGVTERQRRGISRERRRERRERAA